MIEVELDDQTYLVTFRGTDELAKVSNISTITFVATTDHPEDAHALAWEDLKEDLGELAKHFEHFYTTGTKISLYEEEL